MARERLEYSSIELDKDNLPKTKNIPIQRIGPASPSGFDRSLLLEHRVGLDKVSKYTFGMPYEADPIQWKAEHQKAGEQLLFGIGRLVGTTATKFLEGIGYLSALPEGIFNGGLTTSMDNMFSATMSALEEDLKEALPIHHSNRYLEGNILQQMGTLGFWMDDVVDGAAFLISAIMGSKGIGTVTKGLRTYSKLGKAFSRYTKAAKTGQALDLTKRMPNVGAIIHEADLTTMTLFNSYVEAMFEAKDIKDQMIKQGATNEEASEAALSTFKWNLVALMPSNHLTNSLIFRRVKPGVGRLARIKDPKTGRLVDEVKELTKGQKLAIFGRGALASVIAEGPYEENIQHSIQNYFSEQQPQSFSSEAIGGVLGGMVNNFFTDEGQKAIMLGSIIGLIPGGVSAVRTAKAESRNEKLIHALLGQTFAGIENDPTLREIYLKDEDGNIIRDEEGNPQKDPVKLASYFAKQFGTDLNLLGTLISTITGNRIMEDRFREQRLASLAYSMLFHPDGLTHMVTELRNLAQLELESKLKEGEEVDQKELDALTREYTQKAMQYKIIYENVMNMFAGLWEFSGDKNGAFKDMVTAEQFHGAVDQMFWINERNKLRAEKARLESTQVKDPVTGEPLYVDPESGQPIPSVQQAIDIIDKTLPAIEEMIEASQTLYKKLLSEDYQKERFEQYKEMQAKAERAAAEKAARDAKKAKKAEEPTVEEKTEDKVVTGEAAETIEGDTLEEEVKAEEESIKAMKTRDERVKARKENVKKTLDEPVDTELTGAETANEVRRRTYNKKYGERYGHPTLLNKNLKTTFEAVGERSVPVIYRSQVGEMFIDKETNEVIIREVDSGKEHVITKVTNDEIFAGDYTAAQLGITPLKHTVFDFEFSQDGTSMYIQGEEYQVPIGRNLDRFIEEDEDGFPLAVTLTDYKGNTVRFTNPALVEEIAYALALAEEARHVAAEKFLKEVETDFVVVRDPMYPKAEYYVYKVGEEWVVTRPQKKEVTVRGTKALDLGLTTVPEGKVKDRILGAFFSDLTNIAKRAYSSIIYQTAVEEEQQRKTIEEEIRNEIRDIVEHSRPATPKEALEAPGATEVPAAKTDTKRESKKDEGKVKETEVSPDWIHVRDSIVNNKLLAQSEKKKAQSLAKKLFELGHPVNRVIDRINKDFDLTIEHVKVEKQKERVQKETPEKEIVEKKAAEIAESQETKAETVIEDAEKATEEGTEPLNEEESVDLPETEDMTEQRGVRHTYSAAAVSPGYYEGEEYHELNKLLSNPEKDLTGYTLRAEIDYGYEPKQDYDFSWIKHERSPAYVLSMIDKILKDREGTDIFMSFVDRVPIKLTMYDKEGNEVNVGGPLYLHQSGYDNIYIPKEVTNVEAYIEMEKLHTRRVRQEVLRALVADKEVIFTDLTNGIGILNINEEGNVPLHELFTSDYLKNALFGIAGENGKIFTADGFILPGEGGAGNVFVQVETADGSRFPLKLNVSRVGATEAKILLNAYHIAANSKGGFQTIYPVGDDIRASVSGDLTVGEVISYLVLDGEITNQDNKLKNPIKQPHLIDKQLFYHHESGYLYFGTDRINLKRKLTPEETEKFVKHITSHKNVIIDRKKLGKKIDKSFRIGELTAKKGQSYEEFLVYNNILLTNAAKDPQTGTIFSKPVLIYNTGVYSEFLVSEWERTKAVEKVSENASKGPKILEKESEQALEAQKPKKDEVKYRSIDDLHASPEGTVIYAHIPSLGIKEPLGILVNKGGYKTFVAAATDPDYKKDVGPYDGMQIISEGFNNLFNVALKGQSILLERPTVEEAAPVKMEEEEAPKKEEPKKRDRRDIASIGDEEGQFPRRRQYAEDTYEVGDVEAGKKWIQNKFGKKATVKIQDDLVKVVTKTGTEEAFGLFNRDAITLSRAMEIGTEYHESFHRVSSLYLSPTQKQLLHEEAIKKYNLSEDMDPEEVLAEEFRKFMLNANTVTYVGVQDFGDGNVLDLYNVFVDGKEATFSVPKDSPADVVEKKKNEVIRSFRPKLGQRIKQFFHDLWDFIVTLFTGRLTVSDMNIDNLFRVMKKSSGIFGRIRHAEVSKASREWLGNRYYLKHVVKGKQFDHITDPSTFNNIVGNLMYTMVRKSDISSFKDISKLNYITPFEVMAERADKAYKYAAEALAEGKVEESNGWRKLGDLYQEVVDNQEIFMEAMKDFLRKLGIKTILPEDPEDESDTRGDNIERFGKAAFEMDIRDSAPAEIKFLIATLKTSDELDDVTSLYQFVDFDSMWGGLMDELHSLKSVTEMEAVIAEKSRTVSDNHPYLDLLDKLNRSRTNPFDSLRTKFFVTFKKHRNNMTNVSFKRKGSKFELDAGNAETQETSITYSSVWGQDLLSSDLFREGKLDETGINKVLSKYAALSKSISGYYNDSTKTLKRYKEVFDTVIELFNRVSIPMNSDVLESMLDEMIKEYPYANKEEALFRLVVDPNHRVSTFFSRNKGPFVSLLKTGTIRNGAGREIPLQNIYRNERVIRNTVARHYTYVNNDERVRMILGPEGNPYYLYADNSFMTDLVNDLIHDDDVLELMSAVKSNKNSTWLAQMRDPEKKERVKLFVQSSFAQQDTGDRGRHISDLSKIEERLVKIALLDLGYISLPTLAERKNLYSIYGIDPLVFRYRLNASNNTVMYPTEAIDVIVGYMQDEINRIERTKREIDDARRNKTEHLLFENYHFKRNEDGSRNYKEANGIKFHHFTDLNDKVGQIRNGTIVGVDLRAEAIKILNGRINDTLIDFKNLGIISGEINNKGNLVNIKNNLLDHKKVAKEAKDFFNNNESLAVKNILANYTINTIISTVESEKIFFGDPAFYEDADDKIKRYAAIASTGTNLRLDFLPSTLPGERLLHVNNYRSAVIRTQLYNSKELHDSLMKTFVSQYMEQGMTKGNATIKAEQKLKAYTEVDQSDAQAYITPQMHRALRLRMGEWDDVDEEAYDLVMEDKKVYTSAEQQKMDKLYMQPLKFVHFGHVFDFPGLAAPTYYKMSLATLTPQLVKNTQLQELYDRMNDEDDPIDMALFDSAVKAGVRDTSGFLGEDMNGNRIDDAVDMGEIYGLRTFPVPFKDLRRGVVTDPKNELLSFVGTQLRKIVMSNIVSDRDYNVGGKIIKGSELTEMYKDLMARFSSDGKSELFSALGIDPKTFETIEKQMEVDFIIDKAKEANMSESLIEALSSQIDGQFTEYDALPDRKWIQSTFIAQLNKYVVDLKLPGTAMIQMSNFGLRNAVKDNSLKLIDKDGYMEAMISEEVFRSSIVDYDKMSHTERLAVAGKVFKGIGYRIPTQGLNSVVPIKIVGFLPSTNTDTIALPAEFTALTGSDFDIDKLYFLRYNYTVSKTGEIIPIASDPSTRKGRENLMIDIYTAVLTSNGHFLENWTPLDASKSNLKDIATKIEELEQVSKEMPSLYSASPTYQSLVKSKYGSGKIGVGPFALHNVHHVFGQLAALYLKGNIGYGNTRMVDDKEFTCLCGIQGKDNNNILDWLSTLINAHVDIAKDPYLFALNVNRETYDSTALLIRAGVGSMTFPYLAQPVLKEYTDAKAINRSRIRHSKINIKKKYENLLKKAREAEKKIPGEYTPGEIFDEKRLYNDIDIRTPRNSEFYARQLQVLEHYINLDRQAYFLRELVRASQIDTKRYGNTLMTIKSFNNLIIKVIDDAVYGNVNNIFLKTYLGKLYEDSIQLAQTMFSDKFITSSRMISELHQQILDEIGRRYDISNQAPYFINLISDEIYASITSRFFREMVGITPEKMKEMFIGDNSIPARVIRTLKNNPEYSKNAFVKILNPILSFKRGEPDTMGVFNPVDNRTKWSKDRIIEGWELLLNDTNDEISKLAEDLVAYSFYTSGFSRKMHSFFNYVPPTYLRDIGFSDYIKNMKDKFNEPGRDAITSVIHDEVYKSLWHNDDVVPFIPHSFTRGHVNFNKAKERKIDYKAFLKVGDNYGLDRGNMIVGTNANGDYLFRPFIKTIISGNEYLYRYVGYVDNNLEVIKPGYVEGVYTVVGKLGTAQAGKVVKENGFEQSIISDNNVETVTDEHLETLNTLKGYEDFIRVTPDNAVITEYMRQGLEEGTAEEIDESPFLSDEEIEAQGVTVEFSTESQAVRDLMAARGIKRFISFNPEAKTAAEEVVYEVDEKTMQELYEKYAECKIK